MKKALITLAIAAAGIAGAASTPYTFSVPTGGDFYAGTPDNPETEANESLTPFTFTFSVADSMTKDSVYAIAAYYGGYPNGELNTGYAGLGSNGFTLACTSAVVDGVATYTFAAGTGWYNSAADGRKFTIDSSDSTRSGSLSVSLSADKVYTISVVGQNRNQTVTLYDGTTSLGSFSYNGNMVGGDKNAVMGTYFNQDFKAVPEPATATLSLLALAGLAARRRRK